MYPTIILEIIEDLKRLPGIGEKTAERLALHLTGWDDQTIKTFGQHLIELKDKITFCQTCGLLTDQPVCQICKDSQRDASIIMVVADSKDVFSIDKTKIFNGKYHVLQGLIDFSKGIEPKDLNFNALTSRLEGVKEIIIATNSNVEGELTAQYIKTLYKDTNIIISRLGYGLPVGADLKYADQLTLTKAVENRQKY